MHTLKFFHDEVKRHSGLVVSDGTLAERDVLENFAAYVRPIKGYVRRITKLYNEALSCLQVVDAYYSEDGRTYEAQRVNTGGYFYRSEWRQFRQRVTREQFVAASEQVSWLINEDLFRLMEELAPEGFWFGASEGDGACFGYWTDEPEEDEMPEDEPEYTLEQWSIHELEARYPEVYAAMSEQKRGIRTWFALVDADDEVADYHSGKAFFFDRSAALDVLDELNGY